MWQNNGVILTLLISNFRRVRNVVCFLLGNSPTSEFYIPTFRNTLFHLHRRIGMKYTLYLPAYQEGTVFRNVGIYNSDAGELPKRKRTAFRTRRKFEIKTIRFDISVRPYASLCLWCELMFVRVKYGRVCQTGWRSLSTLVEGSGGLPCHIITLSW